MVLQEDFLIMLSKAINDSSRNGTIITLCNSHQTKLYWNYDNEGKNKGSTNILLGKEIKILYF